MARSRGSMSTFLISVALAMASADATATGWSVYGGVGLGETYGFARSYSGSHSSVVSPSAICVDEAKLLRKAGDIGSTNVGVFAGVRRRGGPLLELLYGGDMPEQSETGLSRRVELSVGLQAPESWAASLDGGWRGLPSLAIGAGLATVYRAHPGSLDFYRPGYTVAASLRYEFRHDWLESRLQFTYRAHFSTHQVWRSFDDSVSVDYHLDHPAFSYELGFWFAWGFELGG